MYEDAYSGLAARICHSSRVEISTRHQSAKKQERERERRKTQRNERDADVAPQHTAEKPCAERDPTEASLELVPFEGQKGKRAASTDRR